MDETACETPHVEDKAKLLSRVVFCLRLRLKGDLAYPYKGPRTRDDIVEFANRVAG